MCQLQIKHFLFSLLPFKPLIGNITIHLFIHYGGSNLVKHISNNNSCFLFLLLVLNTCLHVLVNVYQISAISLHLLHCIPFKKHHIFGTRYLKMCRTKTTNTHDEDNDRGVLVVHVQKYIHTYIYMQSNGRRDC